MKDQKVRLYIVHGVTEDTVFETKTRKEIGEIKWFPLQDLPGWTKQSGKNKGRFYLVTPFMGSLKKWIEKYRKRNKKKGSNKNTSIAVVEKSAASEGYDTENELQTDIDAAFDILGVGGTAVLSKEDEEAQKRTFRCFLLHDLIFLVTEQKLKALLGLRPSTSYIGHDKPSHGSTPDSSPIFVDRRPSIATQTVLNEALSPEKIPVVKQSSNKITVATSPIPKYPPRMLVPKTPEIDLDALLKQNLETAKQSSANNTAAYEASVKDAHKKELQALLLGFGSKDKSDQATPSNAPPKKEGAKEDLLKLLLNQSSSSAAPAAIPPSSLPFDPAIVSQGNVLNPPSDTKSPGLSSEEHKQNLMNALFGRAKKEEPVTTPTSTLPVLQKTEEQKNDLMALLTGPKLASSTPAAKPTSSPRFRPIAPAQTHESPRFKSTEQQSMELKSLLLGPRNVSEEHKLVVQPEKSEEAKVDLLKLLMSGRLVQETETTTSEEQTIKRTTSIQIDVKPETESLIKTLFDGGNSLAISQSLPVPVHATASQRSFSDDPNSSRAPVEKKDVKADLLSILLARRSN